MGMYIILKREREIVTGLQRGVKTITQIFT